MRETYAGVLIIMGEKTRSHVDMQSPRAYLVGCVYSNFPHFANKCSYLFLCI